MGLQNADHKYFWGYYWKYDKSSDIYEYIFIEPDGYIGWRYGKFGNSLMRSVSTQCINKYKKTIYEYVRKAEEIMQFASKYPRVTLVIESDHQYFQVYRIWMDHCLLMEPLLL